jgi:prepilin-type N-terminal cleavage/methylation domain-containing protein
MTRHEGSRARVRRGLTLVEVMAAVVVLGVSATGLAAMTFWVGQRSFVAGGASSRAAALVEHADRLASLPFDSLPGRVGCKTVTDTAYPYTRCVSLVDVAPGQRQLTLVLTPTSSKLRPDTLVFERVSATPYNPFQP